MSDKPGEPAGGEKSSPTTEHKSAEQKSPKHKSPEQEPAQQPAEQPAEQPAQQAPAVFLPPEHWEQAEAAFADDDADSARGSSVASSTESVTSSILRYRTILGRTFHSERGNAHYWGSNDERQNEAMDINHHCQTLATDGKLLLAPISKDIKKAVDIGTGTGLWAIDFADEFPGTEVIGTDISPIQPTWVPPNLEFQMEDATQEWTFDSDSLDYVHIRFLAGCVADWTALFKEAYRCLKPGGILESFEPSAIIESDDGTVDDHSAQGQWGKLFVEGGAKVGRPFTVVQDRLQDKAMKEAGFVDIHDWSFKSPIGSWPQDPKLREIGRYAQLTMEQDSEGLILFMASVLAGWSKEQLLVYLAHLRREIRSGKKHGWYWQRDVWGRKPGP